MNKVSVDRIVRSLAERGYVDGKTVVIEQRQAEGRLERLPALARELVSLPVDVIVSVPAAATVAARQATATIPIVMVHAGKAGLIQSLARPGGNVTGTTSHSPELVGKAVGLLRELVPAISRLAVLVISSNIGTPLTVREAQLQLGPARLTCARPESSDRPGPVRRPDLRQVADASLAPAAQHRFPLSSIFRHRDLVKGSLPPEDCLNWPR